MAEWSKSRWPARWRGDRWSGVVSWAIESRLHRRREQLAALLDIHLNDCEWRQHPKPFPPRPAGTTSRDDPKAERNRYLAWRKSKPSGGDIVYLIDIALEDLASALRRCWNLTCEVDQKPSSAGIVRRLKAVKRRPCDFVDRLENFDPETLAQFEDAAATKWPGRTLDALSPDEIRSVAQAALESAPPSNVGRPFGTRDIAKPQLAADLATIYWEYSGRRPGRSVVAIKGIEQGRFKEFVAEVWSLVPPRLRKSQKGGHRTADHLVRLAVDHLAQLEREARNRIR